MNRRGTALILSFGLLSSFGPYTAHAADTTDAISGDTTVAPVKKRTEAEEKKVLEKRKRVAAKKTDLNGSSWDVVYVTSSDPKQKGKKDLFTFQNGQFNSKALIDRGFTWTNYTITVPDEESEMAVWETMQTGKEGIVFIHGEWAKDKMSGSITEQLDGGKKVIEHSFSTVSREAIPPTTEEASGEAALPLADAPKEEPSVSAKTTPGGALVSMESDAPAKVAVAAFEPGTVEEMQP